MAGDESSPMTQLSKGYLEENIGHRLVVVAIVFLVVQSILVMLFYLSRYVTRTLKGIDCWLYMPIAFINTTALCVIGILYVKLGRAGQHIEAVVLNDPTGLTIIRRSQLDKSLEMVDMVAVTASKLVILHLYMRIFNNDRRYRIAIYIIGVIIVAYGLVCVISSATMCKPFSAYWTHKGKCPNIIILWTLVPIPNIVTDVMMLLLPIPAVYKLRVSVYVKIGIFLTFLVGSGGMIASILRMNTFIRAEGVQKDPSYKCVENVIYVIIEASTYLMAACMLALRPLKRHCFGDHSFTKQIESLFSKRSKTTGASYSWRKAVPNNSSEEGIV